MIITFIGHSKILSSVECKDFLLNAIVSNISYDTATFFYCGGYGDFDILCANTVKELKKIYNNIKSFFVSPYMGGTYQKHLKEIIDSGLYDEILYPELENVPYKFAIIKRNHYMIDKSDLVIAYVRYNWGGAYKALNYAKSKNKRIINLLDEPRNVDGL